MGTQKLLKEGLAQPIYDIHHFCNKFVKKDRIEEDDLLSCCQQNPQYETALEKFEDRLLEYELEGKISINNGLITVV